MRVVRLERACRPAAIVALLALLGACGQTGPLFLPDEAAEPDATAPAADPAAPTEEEADEQRENPR